MQLIKFIMQTIKIDQGIDAKLEFEITNIIKAAYEKLHGPAERSKYISDYLDAQYGASWRVTIGKQFQSCGTYYLQQYLKVSFNGDQIEIVRTQGDAMFEIIHKDPGMSGAMADSILVIITNAQQMYKDPVQQTEFIAECLESKHQGQWAVICGLDYNCRVPYVQSNYISLAKQGIRYTILMLSK